MPPFHVHHIWYWQFVVRNIILFQLSRFFTINATAIVRRVPPASLFFHMC